MLEFTRGIISFRRRHRSLFSDHFYKGRLVTARGIPDIEWHGTRLHQPPWGDAGARVLAFTIAGIDEGEPDLHAILNMSYDAIEAELPELPGRAWSVAVDTAQASPQDVVEPTHQARLPGPRYRVTPRSVVVVEARRVG
jgi:glycogen operon protein